VDKKCTSRGGQSTRGGHLETKTVFDGQGRKHTVQREASNWRGELFSESLTEESLCHHSGDRGGIHHHKGDCYQNKLKGRNYTLNRREGKNNPWTLGRTQVGRNDSKGLITRSRT